MEMEQIDTDMRGVQLQNEQMEMETEKVPASKIREPLQKLFQNILYYAQKESWRGMGMGKADRRD